MVLNERFQEGLEYLLPLEEFHNDWWNLLFFIGLAYRHLNEYDKAIDYFKRTLEYNSGHTETLNELGIIFLTVGQIKDAKKVYEEALKIKPNNHELLCNLGIVYLNANDLNKAEEYLLKAKEEKPDDEIVIAWLKKLEALKIKPKNHELLCNLGIVYLNANDLNKAEEYLLKAKAEKPDDEIVLAWLKKLEALK